MKATRFPEDGAICLRAGGVRDVIYSKRVWQAKSARNRTDLFNHATRREQLDDCTPKWRFGASRRVESAAGEED